jgi:hypothetical protein
MFPKFTIAQRLIVLIILVITVVGLCTATAEASGDIGMPHGKASPTEWRSDLAIYSFVVFLLLMTILTN